MTRAIRHGIAAMLSPETRATIVARMVSGQSADTDRTGMDTADMFGDPGLCRADLRPDEPVFRSTRTGPALYGPSVSLPRVAAMIRMMGGNDPAKVRDYGDLATHMAVQGCEQ
ncbi:hypothetical protein JI664_12840 [Rhodobacter sp. NTK016B]|uniref:hypothetical protein n=1 Tax=Rhodobacter sp. NTK016B TaxID=2759676 RepID=UPI001A8CA849|nr:hypothetical protein [Rhodobacter sp. NTK016B]MBN8292854.1 hypothetical protein [Rhodobacter sp. NTK016B]